MNTSFTHDQKQLLRAYFLIDQSFNESSFEITLTVPLKGFKLDFTFVVSVETVEIDR